MSYRNLFLCGLLLVLVGCQQLVDIDNVELARVDDQRILLRDFVDRISQSSAETRLKVGEREGREELLNEMVNEIVLLEEAERQGITVTDQEVQARAAQENTERQRQNLPGVSPDAVRRNLTIEKVVAPHVSEEKVRERYQKIIESTPPNPAVQYEFLWIHDNYVEFAQELERRLRAGTPLMKLADEFKNHPAIINAGRPIIIPVIHLEPWLQHALQGKEPGDVLPPFRTNRAGESGIILIKLIGRWDYLPLQVLSRTIVDDLYQEYLTSLKAQHKIEIHPERLGLLERR